MREASKELNKPNLLALIGDKKTTDNEKSHSQDYPQLSSISATALSGLSSTHNQPINLFMLGMNCFIFFLTMRFRLH